MIVKDMSRLGRNYLQVGFYTEVLFPQKNVRFLAINNSIDSNNASDNDFAPFLNIMNEWYAKDTSNKIKAIFDARMKDGKRCSGSIPYGYNRLPSDKQTLVVDPVASEVVKHLKSSVSYYQRQYFNASSAVERLQERYDRLKEKCQPFLQALEHFPKLVEIFVEKVKELFSIKEAQERKEREDRAAARKEQSKHRRGRNDWER